MTYKPIGKLRDAPSEACSGSGGHSACHRVIDPFPDLPSDVLRCASRCPARRELSAAIGQRPGHGLIAQVEHDFLPADFDERPAVQLFAFTEPYIGLAANQLKYR